MWIDYFRELDTTEVGEFVKVPVLWIDYFRELDTTPVYINGRQFPLWIDYFRELDTTPSDGQREVPRCGLITLGN